jgi:hypothetical protein
VSERKARSEAERRRLSKHLLYEIEMFTGAIPILNAINDWEPSETRTILRNALLESWALHLRNLLSFVYDNRAGKGDAIALDFIGEEWKDKRGAKSSVLSVANAKASKEMAHMSYVRAALTEDEREWHPAPIIAAISEALHRFVDAVADELVTDDFRERARRALPVRPMRLSDHALEIVSGASQTLDAFRSKSQD